MGKMQRLRIFYIKLCLAVFFVLIANMVYAQQIPHFIKYQGDGEKILEETEKGKKEKEKGKEKDLYNLTFRIYNVETGGTALWKETHFNVPIKKKETFEVLLGSFTPLDLKFDEDYWLSIEIENGGEISSRERMTSFGYAYMSEDSYKLGGRYSSDYAFMGHSHVGEDVVTPVAEAVNADMVDGLHANEIGGVRDHGNLLGLEDDDHLQYLTNERGDGRYAGIGWDGLTKLENAQTHIADKNNPHQVTLEQLGHLDNNPEEEAPAAAERGEPTGTEIQGWADDVISWGHSNVVTNLNADMVDGIHASVTPAANYLYPLNANAKFPASILEGVVADSDKLDGKDSSEFSLLGHFHTLMDLSDVTSDLRAAFLAAGTAGASGTNRLATMTDIGSISGLWTDEGSYIYPNNIGKSFQITDTGSLFLAGTAGIGTLTPGNIPGYPVPSLTIGQSAVGNNIPYSLGIFRNGTSANPGTYSINAPALYVEDFSGNAPASVDGTGIVRINAYRIGDATPNAKNATILNVTNDEGEALRVDGLRNTFIGFGQKHITSDQIGSLFVDGKVGIGTAAPRNLVQVKSSQPRESIIEVTNDDTSAIVGFSASREGWAQSGFLQYYGPALVGGVGSELLVGDSVVIGSASGVTNGVRIIAANNGSHSAPIIFATGLWYAAAAERMRITSSGNVGIGTSAPQGKLDVNGAIYQRGAVLHADYVFEPSYKLESIEDHADYMWQEKHLKAVPKAAKTEDGQEIVELGSRDRGVLEELEKAHIYIAQLNERIKKLEAKLGE